jgi:homoserine O-succinyltransferase
MPLRLPDKLPAVDILKKENIFVMNESRAHTQMVRPLKIVVLKPHAPENHHRDRPYPVAL